MEYVTNDTPSTLKAEIDEFILDRQARNLSQRTIQWYTHSLNIWHDFTRGFGIHATATVTASALRHFLLYLNARGHNPGGVNNIFGAVKAYLRWYHVEYAGPSWTNPLTKVKNPRLPKEPLAPVSLEHVRALLATCTRDETGDRDRAVLLVLLDTGIRQQELTDLTVGDVDINAQSLIIRSGKGRKFRTVFFGNRTRRALVMYLRRRRNVAKDAPLWIGRNGRRLTKTGLREIIRRRAKQACIPMPGLHAFRRAFAINSLRSGMDLVTLQRLLGHSSLAIIQTYLALIDDDLRAAHQRHGAVDNLL